MSWDWDRVWEWASASACQWEAVAAAIAGSGQGEHPHGPGLFIDNGNGAERGQYFLAGDHSRQLNGLAALVEAELNHGIGAQVNTGVQQPNPELDPFFSVVVACEESNDTITSIRRVNLAGLDWNGGLLLHNRTLLVDG